MQAQSPQRAGQKGRAARVRPEGPLCPPGRWRGLGTYVVRPDLVSRVQIRAQEPSTNQTRIRERAPRPFARSTRRGRCQSAHFHEQVHARGCQGFRPDSAGTYRTERLGWTITHEHLLVDEVTDALSPATSAARSMSKEKAPGDVDVRFLRFGHQCV